MLDIDDAAKGEILSSAKDATARIIKLYLALVLDGQQTEADRERIGHAIAALEKA